MMTEVYNPSVQKATIECYKIRGLYGGCWADITIDASHHAGRIQIASDYGSWQHYWSACGVPFKEFLIQITNDVHYVAGKFGVSSEYDGPGTVRMYRRMILESRRIDAFSADEARKIWEETEIIDNDAHSVDSFYLVITDSCPKIYEWMDWMPEYKTMINPLFLRFWNEAWPVFIRHLKNELAS